MTEIRITPAIPECAPYTTRALSTSWQNQDLEQVKLDTREGEGIKIGVADTGCNTHDPRLSDNVESIADFTNSPSGPADRNGHGQWCSGQCFSPAASAAGKAMGLHAKVLGDNGSGTLTDVAAGINWLVSEGCHVISCSLGGSMGHPALQEAFANASARGVICVAATGNEGQQRVSFPAAYDAVIAVGAVDQSLRLANFSNRGAVDLVGYGVNSEGLGLDGTFIRMTGTSMACPWIAQVVALTLSAEINLLGRIRTKSVRDLLRYEGFVTDLGIPGADEQYGRGMPDLASIVAQIKHDADAGAVQPAPADSSLLYSCRGVVDNVAGTIRTTFHPDSP